MVFSEIGAMNHSRSLLRGRGQHDSGKVGMIELFSSSLFFWVPRLGRSTLADWNVEGNHMAERCRHCCEVTTIR